MIRHQKDPFKIVTCTVCSLVYTTPRLAGDQIETMYQTDYWQSPRPRDFGYMDYVRQYENYRRTFLLRSRVIQRFIQKPSRLLDIGCGPGYFLKIMEEKGWDVHGVELSKPMADSAKEHLGLSQVRAGQLQAGDYPIGSFDVIALWDVIEHLEAPRQMLADVRTLLKPDGLLILETQDVKSLFARVLGRRWHHYKYMEHLWHFSADTLRELLDLEGFEVVYLTHRFAGKYVSLEFIMERAQRLPTLASKLVTRLLRPIKSRSLYINPYDELIVVAAPQSNG